MAGLSTRPTTHGIADLAAIVALVVTFDLLVAISAGGTWLTLLFGLPVLLFAPGYAVVAALYPREAPSEPPTSTRGTTARTSQPVTGALGGVARLATSVVGSIALVGLVGIIAELSPFALGAGPLLAGITLVTVAAAAVAAVRRRSLPPDVRFAPSLDRGRLPAVFRPGLSLSFALAVVLVASVAGAGVVVATADSPTAEQFTEFGVFTTNDTGAPVTENYSDAAAADRPFVVRLTNEEGQTASYRVVVVRQNFTARNGQLVVTDAVERERQSLRLADGETRRVTYDPDPATDDPDTFARVRLYLYRGDGPADPSASSAYRTLQVWLETPPALPASDGAG